jgi:hypothetical protein
VLEEDDGGPIVARTLAEAREPPLNVLAAAARQRDEASSGRETKRSGGGRYEGEVTRLRVRHVHEFCRSG